MLQAFAISLARHLDEAEGRHRRDLVPRVIAGVAQLSKNGLRYPIPQYGIQSDARAGLGASYS